MASRYMVADGALTADGTALWASSQGGPPGESVPGAGDDAFMDGHTLTLDDNWELTVLDAGGGTIIVASGARTIDASSNVTLHNVEVQSGSLAVACGGHFGVSEGADTESWTGSLTLDSAAGEVNINTNGADLSTVAVTINNLGTTSLTAQGGLNIGAFTVTNGVFTDGGFAHIINGNVTGTAGTAVCTGTYTIQGTRNIAWALSGASYLGRVIIGTGGSLTVTGNASVKGLTVPVGTTLTESGGNLFIYPTANDFMDVQGTVVSAGWIDVNLGIAGATTANSTPVLLGNVGLTVVGSAKTWQQSGRLTCGTLIGRGADANQMLTMTATGGGSIGAITMGLAGGASERSLDMTLSGIFWVVGNIATAHIANNRNALRLNASYIQLSGTLDATGITVTNTAAFIQGGTVSNLGTTVLTAPIRSNGTNIATNNNDGTVNISANDSIPGSRSMMGAGT